MAICASARRDGVRTGQREVHASVVESRWRPTRSGVACVASGREAQRRMIGVRGPLVILHVAAGARGIVQGVVAVHVTIGTAARRNGVQSGQRESRAVMIEGRVHPVAGVVALGASLREIGADVVRTGRSLEILQVTADASRAAQVVVASDVAIRALARRNCVHASQCETGDGVVEGGLRPLHGVMAVLASCREARVRHRSDSACEILLMA